MQFLASFRCFGTGSRGTGRHHGASDDVGDFKKEWLPVIKKEELKRKIRMKKLKERDEKQAQIEARRISSSKPKKQQRKLQKALQDIKQDSKEERRNLKTWKYTIKTATGPTITVKTFLTLDITSTSTYPECYHQVGNTYDPYN